MNGKELADLLAAFQPISPAGMDGVLPKLRPAAGVGAFLEAVSPDPRKPLMPKAEVFELTQPRLTELEIRKSDGPAFWLPVLLVFLAGYVFIFLVSKGPSDAAAFWFLWTLSGWFVVMVVVFLAQGIAFSMWRHFQPDYQAFRQYRRAKEEYQRKLPLWLLTQELWWQSLDGRSFENGIARVFQKRGYEVRLVGKSGDKGVDLIVATQGERFIVQCKAHKNAVGPAAVRELYGTLIDHSEKQAWLISASGFTKGAREFAVDKPIRLLSIRDIIQELLE